MGYVTGTAEPAAVRAALAERLPAYMVPAAVVALAALPLTVNGKLDKRALPAPEYQRHRSLPRPGHRRPRRSWPASTPRCSGVERVGVDDSFFDLGGDSLSAMRLVAAINTGLDAGLAVRAVFEAPTVAQLAPRIGGDEDRLEPLVAVERPAVVPLSFAQNRLWFIDQLQGPSPVYNLAVALRLRGRLDADALAAALADVVGRHESLRTLFVATDGIPQQWWCARAGRRWLAGRRCHRLAGQPAGGGHRRGGAAHISIWRPRSLCGHSFSASPTTNMCWWPWRTISPRTAGRSPRW